MILFLQDNVTHTPLPLRIFQSHSNSLRIEFSVFIKAIQPLHDTMHVNAFASIYTTLSPVSSLYPLASFHPIATLTKVHLRLHTGSSLCLECTSMVTSTASIPSLSQNVKMLS